MSSKAADILLALNSQIKHQSPQQYNSQLPSKSPTKATVTKNANKQFLQAIPEQGPQQVRHSPEAFLGASREDENHEPPECLVQILSKQIGAQIPEGLSEVVNVVQSILKQREKNTFESLTSDNEHRLLEVMLEGARHKNESNMDLIAKAMNQRSGRVEGLVQSGKLFIIPEANISSKRQLEYVAKLDLARMIKIKEGQLRSKMDILHEKISNLEQVESWNGVDQEQAKIERQLQSRLSESMDYNNYALSSEKTKIARQYVKHMQRQRQLLEKRKKEREQRYKQHDAEQEAQIQEAHQMKDLAKRQQILERIQQRRKKRREEEQYIQSKEKEVSSFLAQFHPKNPLYKQKQKEFYERIVKPQERLRQQKLNEIREKRRSLSINDIKHHEESYLNSLKTDRAKREEQFKLILKSRKSEDLAKIYYKGPAHRRMNQMVQATEKRKQAIMQASKLKAMRRRQYSQVIHSKHKPTVDEKKKEQLMSLIETEILRKNKAKKVYKQIIDQETNQPKMVWEYEPLPARDYKSEGKKFFLEAKRLAKRKQSAQSVNKYEQEELPNDKVENSLNLLKKEQEGGDSKLKDIWSARAKQLKAFAGLEVVDAKNFEFIKHNIQNLDSKALQREQLLKKLNLTMEEHIDNKGMLDQFYLQSIKQKMKLLENE